MFIQTENQDFSIKVSNNNLTVPNEGRTLQKSKSSNAGDRRNALSYNPRDRLAIEN